MKKIGCSSSLMITIHSMMRTGLSCYEKFVMSVPVANSLFLAVIATGILWLFGMQGVKFAYSTADK